MRTAAQETASQIALREDFSQVAVGERQFISFWGSSSSSSSLVAKSCPTLETPWTVACQAPLSMGLSRQEYQSGPPDAEIEPASLASLALAVDSFTTAPHGKLTDIVPVATYSK